MRTTIVHIQNMKTRGERIPMITAYDYTSAQIADRAGIPMLLVGDTLGMVILGYPTTVRVTMDDMVHHTRAVIRGSQAALVIGDMPFLSYSTPEGAVRNAGRFVQEAGAQAVKLEGGEVMAPTVRHLVDRGIPVMAHIGLTPQSVHQMGGMRVQGKRADGARRLIKDALALQDAGAFALVLELVPTALAAEITRRLRIPTIGIGAGPECDGQVQVWHDLFGLYTDHVPRHSRQYAHLADVMCDALKDYAVDVASGNFPSEQHGSTMEVSELEAAIEALGTGNDGEG